MRAVRGARCQPYGEKVTGTAREVEGEGGADHERHVKDKAEHKQQGRHHDRRAREHRAEPRTRQDEPRAGCIEHPVLIAKAHARPRPPKEPEQRGMDELMDGQRHERNEYKGRNPHDGGKTGPKNPQPGSIVTHASAMHSKTG